MTNTKYLDKFKILFQVVKKKGDGIGKEPGTIRKEFMALGCGNLNLLRL